MKGDNTISKQAVYSLLMRIPEGKVTTYGDIAKVIGRPRASRAVGRILNRNPEPVTVPCHRVVMSDGTLGGYAFGKEIKKELLRSEGLRFDGNKVAEFKDRRFDTKSLR